MKREVRIQQRLVSIIGRQQIFEPRPLVIVDSKAWVMVRRADFPGAAPTVISRKEWDALPVQGDDQ